MRLFFILFFLFPKTLAASSEPLTSTPFEYAYGGWITVEVYVNGNGPHDFIIDSGATVSVIFENLANEIGEPTIVDGPPRRVIGLSADQTLPLREIGDVRIGNALFPALQSVMLPDWKDVPTTPKGIIGLDILKNYVVEINAQTKTLNLYDPRAHPFKRRLRRGESLRAVAFPDYLGALYFVEMKAARTTVDMIVDLGASGTIINRDALVEILTVSTGSQQRARELVGDAFGVEYEARKYKFNSFSIGDAQWSDPAIIVYDAPVFSQLSLTGAPFGLLGVDFFEGRHLVLDFPGERISIGSSQRK